MHIRQSSVSSPSAAPRAVADCHALVHQTTWLVEALATQLLRSYRLTIAREDLVAVGMYGLVKAANVFDHRPGVLFSSLAFYKVRGAMIDAIRDGQGWHTRAEVRCQRVNGRLARLAEGREAPAKVDSPERLARRQRQAANFRLAREMRRPDDERLVPTPEELVRNQELAHRLRQAKHRLSLRQRQVIELLYNRHEGAFEAVAKEMGVQRAYVFQVHARALALLRRELADQNA